MDARDVVERDRPPAQEGRTARAPSAARRWWRRLPLWQEVALLLVVCCTVIGLVSAFLVQPFRIPSGSMENTLRVGDRVLVDKLAYRFGGAPRRGDVIVFNGDGSFTTASPQNPVLRLVRDAASLVGLAQPDGSLFVKRVIGVPGDHVACCDRLGRITVNGRPVTEPYLYPGDAPSTVRFDIVVPPGRLWVMGDHRSASADSRAHLGDPGGGTVPVSEVIGRVDWVVWPPSRARGLHRPSAFSRVPVPAADGGHG